jgi:hypothetical protein
MLLKAISFALIPILAFSNLVTICPEGKGQPAEVHLIFDSCDAHECHRNEASSSCNNEICNHRFCNDQPVFEAFRVPQHNKTFFVSSVLPASASNPFCIVWYPSPVLMQQRSFCPPFSTPCPTAVLRI